MNFSEIQEQYKKGTVDVAFLMNELIKQFKKDKNSLDIKQLQLLTEYLIMEREGE